MDSFQPLSKERAEEIRKALREDGKAIHINPTGEFVGTGPVDPSPDDLRNAIGKFDTHYRD